LTTVVKDGEAINREHIAAALGLEHTSDEGLKIVVKGNELHLEQA
jgi:hypothetical protein